MLDMRANIREIDWQKLLPGEGAALLRVVDRLSETHFEAHRENLRTEQAIKQAFDEIDFELYAAFKSHERR